MSEVYPHLVFDEFSTKLGERTKTILQHLFPVPKDDSKRVVTFANRLGACLGARAGDGEREWGMERERRGNPHPPSLPPPCL